MADPDWRGGHYLREGTLPRKGLGVARMAAHITYLSELALQRKFGRNMQDREAITFSFDADFQVESYLRHQGLSFVERFDANSYLYVTRAMDYFDLAADHGGGNLVSAFRGVKARFCLISFTSDWLFPTSDNRAIVKALNAVGAPVSFVEIESDKGHDAFLLDEPSLFATAKGFVDAAAVFGGGGMTLDGNILLDGAGSRVDLRLIADMVTPKSRVLDVGCGDGDLLEILARQKGVDARGIELSREGVAKSVGRGLAVVQGDADTDLADYPDDLFDYVILSQTLQATRNPREVLEHMLRIGQRAIVSIPNFGHWRMRAQLLFKGQMPRTEQLPYEWWNTPNIHFCTIRDFVVLTETIGATIEKSVALDSAGQPFRLNLPWAVWNLFGEQAVFLLRR